MAKNYKRFNEFLVHDKGISYINEDNIYNFEVPASDILSISTEQPYVYEWIIHLSKKSWCTKELFDTYINAFRYASESLPILNGVGINKEILDNSINIGYRKIANTQPNIPEVKTYSQHVQEISKYLNK